MIAQANARVNDEGGFDTKRVKARLKGDFRWCRPKRST